MITPDNSVSTPTAEQNKPTPITLESAKQLMEETAAPEKLQEYLAKKGEQQLTATALIEFLHGELVTDRIQRKYDELIKIGTLNGRDLDGDKRTLICNTMASIGLEATKFLDFGKQQDLALFPGKSKDEVKEIFLTAKALHRFFYSSFNETPK